MTKFPFVCLSCGRPTKMAGDCEKCLPFNLYLYEGVGMGYQELKESSSNSNPSWSDWTSVSSQSQVAACRGRTRVKCFALMSSTSWFLQPMRTVGGPLSVFYT